jgi:hypothetical protein
LAIPSWVLLVAPARVVVAVVAVDLAVAVFLDDGIRIVAVVCDIVVDGTKALLFGQFVERMMAMMQAQTIGTMLPTDGLFDRDRS